MTKILRRAFTALLGTALLVAPIMVAPAHAETTGADVYSTPGGHFTNGRLWNTTCEMYSSNVVRCSTDIWATQVRLVGGRYVWKTGWTFNNLSYLPSSRSSWVGNNLGQTNNRWVSGGKIWRTECDTATTGMGGCRSYVWTKQVQAKKSGSQWVYSNTEGWVFNNLVLFSSPTVPAVSVIPRWVVDCAGQFIGPKGLKCGPVRVDNKGVDLAKLGYVYKLKSDVCDYYHESQSLMNRGVSLIFAGDDLHMVTLTTNYIPTEAGVRVGMTVGQAKALYGTAFKVLPKENYGITQYFGSYRQGAFEVQFRVKGTGDYNYAPTVPLKDSDVIAEITAQPYKDDVSWDGC